MFTTPCFIKKNTPELRKKLEELGYIPRGIFLHYDYLCTGLSTRANFYKEWKDHYYHTIELGDFDVRLKEEFIDCGTNEDLFLAIAALRDDSDYMQWFICDNSVSDNGFTKGMFKFSRECNFTEIWSNGTFWKKATVQELIEHFKK